MSSFRFWIFTLLSFPRASMFFMLAFLFFTIQDVLMTIYDLDGKF